MEREVSPGAKGAASGSTLGLRAKHIMDRGELEPDDVVVSVVANRIGESDRQTASFTAESLRVSNIEQRHTLGKLKLPYHRIVVASIGD